jgi:hypothetical protein
MKWKKSQTYLKNNGKGNNMETKKYLYDGRVYVEEVCDSEGKPIENVPKLKRCKDFDDVEGWYAEYSLIEVKPSEFYYHKTNHVLKTIDERTKNILTTINYYKTNLEKDLYDITVYFRKSLGGTI